MSAAQSIQDMVGTTRAVAHFRNMRARPIMEQRDELREYTRLSRDTYESLRNPIPPDHQLNQSQLGLLFAQSPIPVTTGIQFAQYHFSKTCKLNRDQQRREITEFFQLVRRHLRSVNNPVFPEHELLPSTAIVPSAHIIQSTSVLQSAGGPYQAVAPVRRNRTQYYKVLPDIYSQTIRFVCAIAACRLESSANTNSVDLNKLVERRGRYKARLSIWQWRERLFLRKVNTGVPEIFPQDL